MRYFFLLFLGHFSESIDAFQETSHAYIPSEVLSDKKLKIWNRFTKFVRKEPTLSKGDIGNLCENDFIKYLDDKIQFPKTTIRTINAIKEAWADYYHIFYNR